MSKEQNIGVRISQEMKDFIQNEAESASSLTGFSVTMSDIGRKAIMEYMEKRTGGSKKKAKA